MIIADSTAFRRLLMAALMTVVHAWPSSAQGPVQTPSGQLQAEPIAIEVTGIIGVADSPEAGADDPGNLEFGGTFFPVYEDSESGHKAAVIVTRSGGSSGRATVEVGIISLALTGFLAGTVVFKDGEDGPKTLSIDPASLGTPAAAYTVQLRKATGAGLGQNVGGTVALARVISGTVRDAQGNPVPDVLVSAQSTFNLSPNPPMDRDGRREESGRG